MKRTVLVCITILAVAGLTQAQSVRDTDHDLSSLSTAGSGYEATNVDQVCVFCHTPHGSRIIAGNEGSVNNQLPLWNKTAPASASYGIYLSDTMDATPTPFGGGDNSKSALCMSCHDGTVGVGVLVNDPNNPAGGETTPDNDGTTISGNANLGSGATALSNDHPVNFLYADTVATDTGFVAAGSLPAWALRGGYVQCSSCHDPHDSTNYPFLNETRSDSLICTTCHIK